jgi:hypothetical protein
MSTLRTAAPIIQQLPVAVVAQNRLVDLDELLAHAVVSRN